RMRTPELPAEVATQPLPPWTADDLCADLDDLLARGDVERATIANDDRNFLCGQPRMVVEQIVRELLHNAMRAQRAAGLRDPVELRMRQHEGALEVTVTDHGAGITPDRVEAAFEPLSTSRKDGMGLGLYLSRAHAKRLGGELSLHPVEPQGVLARLRLPLEGLS